MPDADQSSALQIVCFEDQKVRGSQGCKEAFFQKGHMTHQQMDTKILKAPPKQAIQIWILRGVSQPWTDNSSKIRKY